VLPLLTAGAAHAAAMAAVAAAAGTEGAAWDAEAIGALLAQPGCFGLLDAEGGMLLARIAADEAEILILGVAPAVRRQGRARRLLAAAAAAAAAAGARTLYLEVAAGNAPARALYAACGYRRVGLRRRYYANGDDALLLAKPLTPAATTAG
jgi:ribosomal-protein-alanine N-acetyltransferase